MKQRGGALYDSWQSAQADLPLVSILQALNLFYVGGASNASKLLSCQNLDGEGVRLPPELPDKSRDALTGDLQVWQTLGKMHHPPW